MFAKKNSILGVDIGTSNIKIVQITHDQHPVLDTYGIVNTPYQLGSKNDEVAIGQMAGTLKSLLDKAGVTAKRSVISFPNSSVFSSVIELPKMNESELSSAVEFEAKKYVPLALSEIDLSWSMIGDSKAAGSTFKILLTAVPKQVTKNYMKVFSMAGLEPEIGEIEALALIRSLIGNSPQNCVIIDIGARSTGLNIIENGFLRLSRNLNIGGDTITDKIAQALNVSQYRAEQFKKDFGVSSATFIPDTIKPVLNIIKSEVKQLLAIYQSQSIKVEKIILVGGGAKLPGIVGFFEDLKIQVELGDPLKAVGYPKNLESVLKRYELSLPIAIGLALRNE
ncbi:MAG: type IV pilus assembly protein PilM [Candidatus Doudnabacteria bacterium]|nr:type IV pilus assembly protein PilM [Candidatus Doudnabacteria bacterium]